jgi:uncharacterized protein (TIGR00269 family)
MFEENDRIAIAVSGGKDSINLLNIVSKIEQNFPESSVYAITIDEGITGYRDEAIRIAAQNCKKLGIQHYVKSFEDLYEFTMDDIVAMAQENKMTPCAYCGILRRRALNILARESGANKIATAHTLDDEIQTFFLNIIHGDPLRIARSDHNFDNVKNRLIPRVKPFRVILERESALYAYIKKISFQEVPCPYSGDALRNDVRKSLNRLEVKHSGMKYTINSSFEKIKKSMKLTVKKTKLKECNKCGEPATVMICQACQLLNNLSSKQKVY